MTRYPTDNSAVSETAWECVMFAAIKAGLEQGVFGRRPEDLGSMTRVNPAANVQPVFGAHYTFHHAGLTFEARIRAYYGGAQLCIDVWVLSETTASGTEGCYGCHLKHGFDVLAHGWIERENGFYLHGQSSPRTLRARRRLRRILKACSVSLPDFYVRPPLSHFVSRRGHA